MEILKDYFYSGKADDGTEFCGLLCINLANEDAVGCAMRGMMKELSEKYGCEVIFTAFNRA